jgi:hypothetical protein
MRPAVVDVGGGVEAESAVAVLVVVPGAEVLAVCLGGLDRGGTGREGRRQLGNAISLPMLVLVVFAWEAKEMGEAS